MENNNTDHVWSLMAKKLSGEATAGELVALDMILRENPHANYSKEIMHDLWNSKPRFDKQYAENKYKELVLQIKNMGIDEGSFTQDGPLLYNDGAVVKTSNKKKWIVSALSFTVIAAVAIIFLFKNEGSVKNEPPEALVKNEVSTKNGSKSSLILPDGTKVLLNAGSKLNYDKTFGAVNREVKLTGEAFFEVTRNEKKPFIVHTASMDIKVLGTAFNVKCYPGEKNTEASLVHGSIEVTLKDREEKIFLKPNEKLIVSNEELQPEKINAAHNKDAAIQVKPMIALSHLTVLPADNTILETAWIENRLVFNDEAFGEVAAKMERWYGVTIIFNDNILKVKHFTGIFEKETVAEAFAALEISLHFNFKIKNETITITK